MSAEKIRIGTLRQMKEEGRKIVAMTAYDYPTARLVDQAGVDIVLVGDSLGTVLQGHDSTIPVTMDQMIYHTSMVSRAIERPLIVADMPFLSYKISKEQALTNAGRFLSEGGAEAVKVEGCEEVSPMIDAMVGAGIPVMGHIGLTPQAVHALGGYRVQGRGVEAVQRLKYEARRLEELGCFAIVLELIAAEVSTEIRQALSIPTIGIGSGIGCDGQVLVLHDAIGFSDKKPPSFVKEYAKVFEIARDAVAQYAADVRTVEYPGEEHIHH
jgi:3-methyl-2-oxobutanoate hydroxymethyltransferase